MNAAVSRKINLWSCADAKEAVLVRFVRKGDSRNHELGQGIKTSSYLIHGLEDTSEFSMRINRLRHRVVVAKKGHKETVFVELSLSVFALLSVVSCCQGVNQGSFRRVPHPGHLAWT